MRTNRAYIDYFGDHYFVILTYCLHRPGSFFLMIVAFALLPWSLHPYYLMSVSNMKHLIFFLTFFDAAVSVCYLATVSTEAFVCYDHYPVPLSILGYSDDEICIKIMLPCVQMIPRSIYSLSVYHVKHWSLLTLAKNKWANVTYGAIHVTSFFSYSRKQYPFGCPFLGPVRWTKLSIYVIFPKGSNNLRMVYLICLLTSFYMHVYWLYLLINHISQVTNV
jgi:hypothetical protein